MRIAFCIRPEYKNPLGGDAIQMLKTKEYLEKNYAVLIDIITTADEISKGYDLVHIFNYLTYEVSKKFISKAIQLNIPIVSSPIYWDYSYASTGKLFNRIPFLNSINEISINILKKIVQLIGFFYIRPAGVSSRFRQNAIWMYEKSTIIAPNSIEEAKLLLKWVNVDTFEKIRVVYNATEKAENQLELDSDIFHEKYNIPKDYILQVGRIEFCKNQINLVSALMNNPEIPIVFLGKIFDSHFYKKLKKLSTKRGNVFFIDAVFHSEVSSFYKYAKIHVLLSLRESPGLVSIEALSNDCPIVISDERFLPVKTYFSNQPYVANPLNIKEIRNVVLEAYRQRKISAFDFNMFSWDTAAEQTYNIYKEILNK